MATAEHAIDSTESRQSIVDISDLVSYLEHNSSVSGIQRVVAELLPILVPRGSNWQLAIFDEPARRFLIVPSETILEILEQLGSLTNSDAARLKVKESVASLVDSRSAWSPVVAGPGTVFLTLGAAWSYDGYFQELQRHKLAGARLVVLLYDLIPIMTNGFPRALADVFSEYAAYLAHLADRVPCISVASRLGFEDYCAGQGWDAPPGMATGLPPGIGPDSYSADQVDAEPAWPRPFALFVGTVESRKNHLLALRAWRLLVDRLGSETVPDLVCVGKIGWNAQDFLRELTETASASGRIHILGYGVPDRDLYRMYRDCEFTVYPSTFEGWGLPVSESIAFGKPVITTNVSSLPEAGGSSAIYVDPHDANGLAVAIEQLLTDPEYKREVTARLQPQAQLTWADVAAVLQEECALALDSERTSTPRLSIGREYGLAELKPFVGGYDGTEYIAFVNHHRRQPITTQVASPFGRAFAQMAVGTNVAADCAKGLRFAAGGELTIRFRRGADGPITLCVATLHGTGHFRLSVTNRGSTSQGAPVRVDQAKGSVFVVGLGNGLAGQAEQLDIFVEKVGPGSSGLVLTSLLVVDSGAAVIPPSAEPQQNLGWPAIAQANHGASVALARWVDRPLGETLPYKAAVFGWRVRRKAGRILQERRARKQ